MSGEVSTNEGEREGKKDDDDSNGQRFGPSWKGKEGKRLELCEVDPSLSKVSEEKESSPEAKMNG